ncbi:MAG: cytochrome c [Myxococcales bacterium]|jgi:cytochrome c553
MKTALKVLLALLVVVAMGLGGMFLWARSAVASKLAQRIEVHEVDFPVPFPLSEEELAALRAEAKAQAAPEAEAEAEAEAAPDAEAEAEPEAEPEAAPDPLAGVDLDAIAFERAIARGKHLVEARYACTECHGDNFGGGVMVDDPAMGQLLGPNITTGKGGKTADYTTADWDRIVRHGIKPDGSPAAMPAEDFQLMSDHELSDIVAYLRTVPPVDNEVPPVSLGPLGTVLMATGKLPISAEVIRDHMGDHPRHPPEARPDAEFGKHLAGVCTGCHRPSLQGGPIAAGPPDWAPARNLTPHADGLEGWTYEQFVAAMRQGVRPDGTQLKMPMSLMMPYARKMTDTELRALWAYLQSVPARPTGT